MHEFGIGFLLWSALAVSVLSRYLGRARVFELESSSWLVVLRAQERAKRGRASGV